MKKAIEGVEAFDTKNKYINVIIETPKGSRVKYVYTPDSGLFRVKRVLPEGMIFPFNFGFIPKTFAEDGDPLDILLLNDESIVPGSLVRAQLIAVIKAKQTENGKTFVNDRIVGMAIDEEMPPEFFAVELDKRRAAQIEFFFATYNRASGKQFKISGIGSARHAAKLIRKAQKIFNQKN